MDAWRQIVVLSIGGALGVNARHWLGVMARRWVSHRFPWSTVAINVSGSFAIGIGAVVLSARWPYPLARLGLIVGFLGGYTTFSSFTLETLALWERGDWRLAFANAMGSVLVGLVAVVLGAAGRALVGPSGSDRPEARIPADRGRETG